MASANPLSVMPTLVDDLDRLESELLKSAMSDDPYLTEIAAHLIKAGGKRVRPGFCLAAAATAPDGGGAATPESILAGVSIELVHLGSLYHDDVMDDATTRRTVASVNAKWGNLKAILAGDFLLARASEIAAGLGVEVAGLLAATIARLCEGQVLELQYTYDAARTEQQYLRSIGGKTAALLAAACRIGGIVGGVDAAHRDALTTFGYSYGMAFQVVDDVLDLVSTEAELGKPTGHDLEEGVYTLPVIAALLGPDGDRLRPLLTDAMTPEQRDEAVAIIRGGGWIDGSIERARTFAADASNALAGLPDSIGIDGLSAAAKHLVDSVEAAAATAA
ncbi:MAG: polyprenyl synthetase family protein [Microthrixaceae bacterium]|nr:polyprenyl synthetase family protein [Microthrixaceae bacterium]HMT24404.1 polyprenyl synthetase family protein [Microthrixaceae bacterium]HMT61195.1 polyprenyl synthetase family protein [Microthrixaceae bacterium]